MILIVLAFVAVATVPLTGGCLREMGSLPIRWMPLAWLAIGLQTVLVSTPWTPSASAAETLHLSSYAVAAVFAVANWTTPGIPLITVGGALNLVAIVANGGVMPASASALSRAGIEEGVEFSNSDFVANAKLQVLGDIFAVPAAWPLSNVFSIGDILVIVGIGYLAHRQCRPVAADVEQPAVAEHQSGLGA
ncbi:MAG: DUF5317 domain-containing protein [Ilumatobacteraceae bacterium]